MTHGGMVIVGAGKAGARAAVALRDSGWQGEITLIGAEELPPYDRPPLSKAAITDESAPGPVLLLDEAMIASLNVRFLPKTHAERIDRAAKQVVVSGGQRIPYEKLLIATGARARVLTLKGAERALTLRTFGDMQILRDAFKPGVSVAIIGGGFIGLEVATSAAKCGCNVAVIESQPRILMRGVPEAIARIVHERHVTAGVTMITGAGIAAIEANTVLLTDGREVPADIVVAGIGAAPDVRLAEASGLAIDNGIATDATLRTSDPDIYAAGDCCSFPHQLFGSQRIRLEAWRNAQDQTAVAAENMLGAGKPYVAVPWFWSDQYDLSLQVAGLAGTATQTVERKPSEGAVLLFHLDGGGRLVAASGIGPGNAIARDIKLAEMLIAKQASPSPAALADPTVALKSLLKG